MRYVGAASRTARTIMPRMTFGPMLDLGLNPEACIRTVEGPLCPLFGVVCEIERFAFKRDNHPVALRATDCAIAAAFFCGAVFAPDCAGVLATSRAPPCAVAR